MASNYRAALRLRDTRWIVGAYLIDDTASWGYSVVLAAYVYGRTGSTGWIAAIACTRWISGLLFSGVGGLLADKYDRAQLIAMSAVLCSISMQGMTIAIERDGPLWVLVVLSAMDTVLSSPVRPATGALLPDVVPERDLVAANGLFAVLENLVVVLGPGIGGLLLLAGEPAAAMAINAASYLVAAVLFLQISTRSRGDAANAEQGRLEQWSAGVRAIATSRTAVLLIVFQALSAAVYGASVVVFAPLSLSFGTGVEGYSYLLAASAVGSVIGALVTDRLASGLRLAPILVGALIIEAVPFWISDFVGNPILGAALQVVSGVGLVVLDVLAITALQRDLQRAVLGRALAAVGAICLVSIVIGNLAASAVISFAGLSWTLGVIGLGFPVIGLLALPALRAADRATAGMTRALRPLVELLEGLDLFDGASQRTLEQLAASATRRGLAPGAVLITQGEEADALYLLESGRLCITVDGRVLPDVDAPGYVGELGLLHNTARTATVTAVEASSLFRISAEEFRAALDSSAASLAFNRLAGERLSRTPTMAG